MFFMVLYPFCLTAALALAATLTTGATQATLFIVSFCVSVAALAAALLDRISTRAGENARARL